ncbi:ABC transporter substrate-binding protein [Rhizobium sp. TRM95796]|uniref:ABC transporter substrate-binding protein n=1 Tax=Rhizobium sp. TRM95796 TaxID=2979862 RepID=UPI0021E81B3B|nr:sugar ABC transporter substrate-binding protein [Rhizobium sp. TRM95796]MCV3768138.1 sugar ABC transporter substrate-binding protein [Rhizobium sp. TRM95796]
MHKLFALTISATAMVLASALSSLAADKAIHMIRCGADSGGGTPSQNRAVADWEAANTGFKVNVEYVPWGQCENKAMTLAAAGNPPAVAYIGSRNLPQLMQNDMIVPVKFTADELSMYAPQVIKTVTIDGETWGIPRAFSSKALFYNKDLFSKAGLDPNSPPATWAEFVAAAKVITEKTGAMGVGIPAASFNNTMHQFLDLVYSNGGSVLNDKGEVVFNSPNNIEAMRLVKDLVPYAQPGPIAYDRVKLSPLFSEGRLAMFISGPWERKALPKGLNWATAPVPHGPRGKSGSTLISDSLVVFKKTGVEEQAVSLVKFLTSPDNQLAYDIGQGSMPVRFKYKTEELIAADPNWTTFFNSVENGGPEPLVSDFIAMQDAINAAIQAVVLGESNPEDAVSTAAGKLDAAK